MILMMDIMGGYTSITGEGVPRCSTIHDHGNSERSWFFWRLHEHEHGHRRGYTGIGTLLCRSWIEWYFPV